MTIHLQACTFIIFGATGNLSRIKLIPALYHLEQEGHLPPGTMILGSGRRDWSHEKWLDEVREMVTAKARGGVDEVVFKRFCERLDYFKCNLGDSSGFSELNQYLANDKRFPTNIAYYLSVAPNQFGLIAGNLSQAGLLEESHGWRRVIIEKPFGHDLDSARDLQSQLKQYLHEKQIYRIDHYLGKGTVQNVLVFRFANLMMEPLWNRNYIDHIQITHSETLGVGGRGAFYENAGALRDMIQSHLLQLLTLVAMEPPVTMKAEDLRDEKVKVLRSIRRIPQNAVSAHAYRGQYTAGTIDGQSVVGYADEDDVPPDSVTETYAALKLYIDNWRWKDVPFYLRTGKRLTEARSMISICFKQPPQHFFHNTQVESVKPNWLLLGIQPEECLRMEMTVKQPGLEVKTRRTSLDASFIQEDTDVRNDAYEDLLLDVIKGDRSLFLRYDEVEEAWKVVDPVLRAWSIQHDYIPGYPAGSWGPPASRRLFEKEGQKWRHSVDPE